MPSPLTHLPVRDRLAGLELWECDGDAEAGNRLEVEAGGPRQLLTVIAVSTLLHVPRYHPLASGLPQPVHDGGDLRVVRQSSEALQ